MSRTIASTVRLLSRTTWHPLRRNWPTTATATTDTTGAVVELSSTHCVRLFSDDSSNIYDPVDMTPPIPAYVEKQGETTGLKRARLLYQSRKRGMLENGLLLSTFAGQFLNSLTEDQLKSYDKLINQPTNDWEIYYWITGVKEVPEEFQSDVMTMLQKHANNEDKVVRIRQPDL